MNWSSVILSNHANLFLGFLAFVLAALYGAKAFYIADLHQTEAKARKAKLFARSVNWGAFSLMFVFFEIIVAHYGLITWRASARISLFFLMVAEIACNLDGFKVIYLEIKKCRLIQSFQSLLP